MRACLLGAAVFPAFFGVVVLAQPNPYRTVADWAKAPPGRTWGEVSSVSSARNGGVWIAERCGGSSCAERADLAPIHLLDLWGNVARSFGAGLFVWPHGIYEDRDGYVWVTDARGEGGKGHQVFKFSPDGRVVMTLGTPGVAGLGPDRFNGPTSVVVGPNGDIFVSEGHEAASNNRIIKFASDGTFIKAWGGTGTRAGQFTVPHALAMDSQGRLFVADRDNNRIQVFDQEGRLLEVWVQFGRPSGLFIGPDDTIYVSDNQSNAAVNPHTPRGIRVGRAQDGEVTAFIPDPKFDPAYADDTGAHGVAADAGGAVYGAEVSGRTLMRYAK
jgi:sugar lactone lactonase YvrE